MQNGPKSPTFTHFGTSGGFGSFPQCGFLPSASQTSTNPFLFEVQRSSPSPVERTELRKASEGDESNLTDQDLESSRRSSSVVGAEGGAPWLLNDWSSPLGTGATLRLSIRRLRTQKLASDGSQCAQTRRSIFRSLARSLGRSSGEQESSQDSSASSVCSTSGSSDDCCWYELTLIEARNVSSSGGGRGSTAARSSHQQRRESVLGSLVGGARPTGQTTTSGTNRRNSADSFHVRIFKHSSQQSEDQSSSEDPKQTQAGQKHQLSSSGTLEKGPRKKRTFDSVSLHSVNSVCSQVSSDFVQLPTLIREHRNSSDSINFGQHANLVLGQPKCFSLTCRRSEFPLRVSLYQVSRRGGSRYTIGHCVISAGHFEPTLKAIEVGQQQQQQNNSCRRLSGADSSIGSLELVQYEEKFAVWPAADSAMSEPQVQLEYRLFPTILEAVK